MNVFPTVYCLLSPVYFPHRPACTRAVFALSASITGRSPCRWVYTRNLSRPARQRTDRFAERFVPYVPQARLPSANCRIPNRAAPSARTRCAFCRQGVQAARGFAEQGVYPIFYAPGSHERLIARTFAAFDHSLVRLHCSKKPARLYGQQSSLCNRQITSPEIISAGLSLIFGNLISISLDKYTLNERRAGTRNVRPEGEML